MSAMRRSDRVVLEGGQQAGGGDGRSRRARARSAATAGDDNRRHGTAAAATPIASPTPTSAACSMPMSGAGRGPAPGGAEKQRELRRRSSALRRTTATSPAQPSSRPRPPSAWNVESSVLDAMKCLEPACLLRVEPGTAPTHSPATPRPRRSAQLSERSRAEEHAGSRRFLETQSETRPAISTSPCNTESASAATMREAERMRGVGIHRDRVADPGVQHVPSDVASTIAGTARRDRPDPRAGPRTAAPGVAGCDRRAKPEPRLANRRSGTRRCVAAGAGQIETACVVSGRRRRPKYPRLPARWPARPPDPPPRVLARLQSCTIGTRFGHQRESASPGIALGDRTGILPKRINRDEQEDRRGHETRHRHAPAQPARRCEARAR